MKPFVGSALTASASSNLVGADAVAKLPKSAVRAESNHPRVLSGKHDSRSCKPSAVEDLFIPTHFRLYGDRPEKFRPSKHRNALKTAPSSAMSPSSFWSQPHAHNVHFASPLVTRNDNMQQPLSASAAARSRQRSQFAFASETFYDSSQQKAAPAFAKLAGTAVHSPVSLLAFGSGASRATGRNRTAGKTESSPISDPSTRKRALPVDEKANDKTRRSSKRGKTMAFEGETSARESLHAVPSAKSAIRGHGQPRAVLDIAEELLAAAKHNQENEQRAATRWEKKFRESEKLRHVQVKMLLETKRELGSTKQESERLAQRNTELESKCRSMRTALAAAEENVAALALAPVEPESCSMRSAITTAVENVAAPASTPVELNAAVVSATIVVPRPTFPNAPILGGAPSSAPVEPHARAAAVSRTALVVPPPVLSPPGALDPGPVQGRTLPPGVRMLESGRARATIWFKKQSLFLGVYHIVEHAIEARAIADERRWKGPYMKKASYLQTYVFDEVKRRGIARCGAHDGADVRMAIRMAVSVPAPEQWVQDQDDNDSDDNGGVQQRPRRVLYRGRVPNTRGVSKKNGRYFARITIDGKSRRVSRYYDRKYMAFDAYEIAQERHFEEPSETYLEVRAYTNGEMANAIYL
jgi:hypothetical protein